MDGGDALNEFVENICNHFSLTNDSVKCKIRNHSENLIRYGDMSFPLHYVMTHVKGNETNCELPTTTVLESSTSDSVCGSDSNKITFKEKLSSLKEASANWQLKIEKCEIRRNRVVIYLQKDCAYRTILKNVLDAKHLYGRSRLKRKRISHTTMKRLCAEAAIGSRFGKLEESVPINSFRSLQVEQQEAECINNFRHQLVDGWQQLDMPVPPILQCVNVDGDNNDVCIQHPEVQHMSSKQYEVFGDLDSDDDVCILQHKLPHVSSVKYDVFGDLDDNNDCVISLSDSDNCGDDN